MKSALRVPAVVSRRLPARPATAPVRHATKTYRGAGREVALVGMTGTEISSVGLERQKRDLMYTGRLGDGSFLNLGVNMGVFEIKPDGTIHVKKSFDDQGRFAVSTPVEAGSIHHDSDVAALRSSWERHLMANIGIRELTEANIGWNGAYYMTARGKKTHTDFGAPLPTGFGWDSIGKVDDLRGGNDAMNMSALVTLRANLDMGVHPQINRLDEIVDLSRTGYQIGTGVGSLDALEELMKKSHRLGSLENLHRAMAELLQQTNPTTAVAGELLQALDAIFKKVEKDEKRPGTKELPDLLANTPGAYVARMLGISGLIGTHVGACESSLGAISDLVHAIARGRVDAGYGGGFESALTPSAIYGFNYAQALITNEEVVGIVRLMLAEGALDSAVYGPLIEHVEKRGGVHSLPVEFYRLASQPFSRWRRGFVMGKGAGVGFFMPLDQAIATNRPIVATVAGVGDKYMDSPESIRDERGRMKSIADMGDGPQRAFLAAVAEAKANYSDFDVNDIGALVAHGTSTPINEYMERRNFHEALKALGRQEDNPLLITGDKGLQGHRIGGNYLALAIMILNSGFVPPVTNYRQAGRRWTGSALKVESLGDSLDDLFPLTSVVGAAGLGAGEKVPMRGKYVHVNAAGFGHINSGVLLRRWDPDSYDWKPGQRGTYNDAVNDLRRRINETRRAIDLGWLTYV